MIVLYIAAAWAVLGLIAVILISLRPDKERIYRNIARMVNTTIILTLAAWIVIYCVLPFSIPYSIKELQKNR